MSEGGAVPGTCRQFDWSDWDHGGEGGAEEEHTGGTGSWGEGGGGAGEMHAWRVGGAGVMQAWRGRTLEIRLNSSHPKKMRGGPGCIRHFLFKAITEPLTAASGQTVVHALTSTLWWGNAVLNWISQSLWFSPAS